MSLMKRLKAIDAFPKIQEDFYSKTMSGGVITIICTAMMVILFLSELGLYLTSKTVHKLEVDTSRGEKIVINMDITLPRMPCDWVSVDAVDASGRVQSSIEHEVFRQRLSSRGRKIQAAQPHEVGPKNETVPEHLKPGSDVKIPDNYCGSCYGAEEKEGDCCNTCESVRQRYQKKGWVMPEYDTVEQCKREGYQDSMARMKNEGCRIWGKIEVAKVAGRVQVIPGRTYEHAGQLIPDLQALRNQRIDISHSITALSFGEKGYPGQVNPLAGVVFDQRKKTSSNPDGRPGLYSYNVKVVPTSYTTKGNLVTESNQYSASDSFFPMDPQWIPHAGIPGIMIFYDMSAIKVDVVEKGTPFLHFVTNVCAIVGGLWAVSGLIDSTVYHGQKMMRKKIDIGKYG